MLIFQKVAYFLGIDKAILFSVSARILQGIGGVISLFFVAFFLSDVEQGFYFTFGSIMGIQIFFELGLNGIITQYVAHEASHLVPFNNMYEGELKYKSRIASLLHFFIKWYGALSVGLFVILSVSGYLFFSHFYNVDVGVDWLFPWLLVSIGTTISFVVSPFIGFIEGLGKVKEIAKMRLIQQVVVLIALWCGLFIGLKLYVGFVSVLAGLCVSIYFIFKNYFELLRSMYFTKITEKVSYRNEILPFQWKIAVSWISGYFIFQLFNPVLFATEGAAIAGQMGMTLTTLNTIQSLTMNWITTKVPLFSNLISLKKYFELDLIFDKSLKQSVLINLLTLFLVYVIIFWIRSANFVIGGKYLGDRFLDYLPMFLLMVPIFLNQFVFSWATYLRCHKKEPFLLLSVISAVLCGSSTILMGKYYGVIGVTGGYALITFLLFYSAYMIFQTSKNELHKQ